MELRDAPPLRTDDRRIVAVGTGLWLLTLIGLAVMFDEVRDAGLLWWIPMSACGVAWGLLGLLYLRIRPAQLARREAKRDAESEAKAHRT